MNPEYAKQLSFGMAAAASSYPNHDIANAMSRVAQKLESFGAPFAPKLTPLDYQVIQFYYGIQGSIPQAKQAKESARKSKYSRGSYTD